MPFRGSGEVAAGNATGTHAVPAGAFGGQRTTGTARCTLRTLGRALLLAGFLAAPVAAQVEVPTGWALIPTGLTVGDSFRLLILSQYERTAADSDIDTYNAWLQSHVSGGDAAIRDYAPHFRVVASTADTDARDNTSTTYTDDNKGVRIYWLDGNKVADNYEDFYDGTWDDTSDPRNEWGNFRNINQSDNICTGSTSSGTERSIGSDSIALGQDQVGVGRVLTSGGALSSQGSIFFDAHQGSSTPCPLYGLSPVFTVVVPPSTVDVPATWDLIPSGLGVGDSFRLLFLTSTTRDARASTIGPYNSFVQNRASNGHAAIQPYTSRFRAVGSTADTDARDNTLTNTSLSSTIDSPIYWLNGNKVADNYDDFYDGDWDDEANPTDERGDAASTLLSAWTGSKDDGTEALAGANSHALGASTVARGLLGENFGNPLHWKNDLAKSSRRPLFALSPVFRISGVIPFGWSLTPSGVKSGDSFRLLFVTSRKRNAVSTDIATYNTFVQQRAAAGHDDLGIVAPGFRAVGCTAEVDARDNTFTNTNVASTVNAPIYWLNGNKVADGYRDFYDRDWDDEASIDESGSALAGDVFVATGCDHDGTEARLGTRSDALGSSQVRLGRPNSTAVTAGPLSSPTINSNDRTQFFYALSPVLTLGEDPSVLLRADLTVGVSNNLVGYRFGWIGSLSLRNYSYFGRAYDISWLNDDTNPPRPLALGGAELTNRALKDLVLILDGTEFAFRDSKPVPGNPRERKWDNSGLDWEKDQVVKVVIKSVDGPPVRTEGWVNQAGTTVTLGFDENLADASDKLPPTSAFTVTAAGSAVPVVSISVGVGGNQKRVALSLGSAIEQNVVVRASYADPSSSDDAAALQDDAGHDVVSFTNVWVTNNSTVDRIPPRLTSGHYVATNGVRIVLRFNENLADRSVRLPPPSAFTVIVDGSAVPVTSMYGSASDDKVLVLRLGDTIKALQTVSVGYADPTAGNDTQALQDEAGNDAASFTDLAVPNRSEIPVGLPDAPVNLTATAIGKSQIDLRWIAPPNYEEAVVSGYRIEVSPDGSSDWTELEADTTTTATTYSHTTLIANTTRSYRVSAINSLGTGPTSDVATATTHPIDPPDAPTDLTATANGMHTIDLSWTAPGSDSEDFSGYRIEWRGSGGVWYDLVADTSSTATTYSDSGLNPNTTRRYRVSAVNAGGPGPPSNEAVIQTAPPAEVEVLPNWGLIPSGLGVGDRFRLLFLTTAERKTASSEIYSYNDWVQDQAVVGHHSIRRYGRSFRAVGSTAAVDARDNTGTTYTDDDKGVPIYWLDGQKVADDYADFYDGSWDNTSDPENEWGNFRNIDQTSNICTGSETDGTERFFGGNSIALGQDEVGVGRVLTSGGALSSPDNAFFDAKQSSNGVCPLYAISVVFTVVQRMTEVPADWELAPTGLGLGDSFRLLFLSSTKRALSSSSIADYNSFVKDRASGGHSALQSYANGFRAVGSTADTDARGNTDSRSTANYKGVPIYWLNGSKVANDYEDFYDGSWSNEDKPKNENGDDGLDTSVSGNYPGTGSKHDGTEKLAATSDSLGLGGNQVTVGRPNSSATSDGPLSSPNAPAAASERPLYALSQIFIVGIPSLNVSSDSALVPPGLGVGQSFRLLFVTRLQHQATSSDITDYDRFVQSSASDGYTLIRPYSIAFKALASTADIDARDHTETTQGAAKDVPIYWVNGSKVADDSADFYDGSWDDQVNYRESGGQIGTGPRTVWTGSNSSGRLSDSLAFQHGLGNNFPAAGQIGSSSVNPIFSSITNPRASRHHLYGLSPVFTVVAPPPEVPGAITDLAATASSPARIDLAWTAPDDNGAAISGYRIEVSSDAGANWSVLEADTGSAHVSYAHRGLAPASSRHYRVTAINAAGRGPVSNIDDATTPYPVVTASFGASSYDATEGGTAASVVVKLSQAPLREVMVPVTATNQGTTSNADYTGVPVTLTFGATEISRTITVTATDDSDDDDGESVQLAFDTLSASVSAGSPATATVNLVDNEASLPGAPTDLAGSADGAARIDLSWSEPGSDGGGAITGYRIEVSADVGANWTELEADTGTTDTTYTHSGLTAGAYRHYRVSAINPAGTGPASDLAGATTPVILGASLDLVPSGLSAGDSFRLLFLSSTRHNARADAISTYNTFIQDSVAAGHADIQAHSALFRAVGCTADTDARDNTATTYTATNKGVPIYWLAGNMIADDYEDFYDATWDDEEHDRNESGTDAHDTSLAEKYPWTGCAHDGTGAGPLGSGTVRVGRPNSLAAGTGPLSSNERNSALQLRHFYGLSPVFTVVTAPDAITDLVASASGPTQINLGWTAPGDNGAAISGYKIEVSPDGSTAWSELEHDSGTTDTSFSHSGLLPGASRHYRVSAINFVGAGPASNVDDATTPFPMLSVSFGAAAYTASEGGGGRLGGGDPERDAPAAGGGPGDGD